MIYKLYQNDENFFYALLEANKRDWSHFLYKGMEYQTQWVNQEINKWH